jgi:hypothetical protein
MPPHRRRAITGAYQAKIESAPARATIAPVIRKLLLGVPVLGPWVERRWMPDPVERDMHREVVRARLEEPVISEPSADPVETNELGGAPEEP